MTELKTEFCRDDPSVIAELDAARADESNSIAEFHIAIEQWAHAVLASSVADKFLRRDAKRVLGELAAFLRAERDAPCSSIGPYR